jgi:hypothetical protein
MITFRTFFIVTGDLMSLPQFPCHRKVIMSPLSKVEMSP